MAEMQVEIAESPRGMIVKVLGHAGYLEAGALHTATSGLVANQPPLVVFDLAGVTFIASLAMGAMTNLRRAMLRYGGVVKIAAPPPLILEALQAAGMHEMFEITSTVNESLGQG